MHEEDTYFNDGSMNMTDTSERRALYWLLYVAERYGTVALSLTSLLRRLN
jgi:hypothetical protein